MTPNGDTPDTLVPARIINEFVYCKRLAWLEWEAKAFVDSDDTIEGRDAHRGVDRPKGGMRKSQLAGLIDGHEGLEALDDQADEVLTSLTLASEKLGVVAKLDRVEISAGEAVPVETKHGRPRTDSDCPVWEPEQAQMTVQALLLREQGYRCDHAEVYFPATRTRHVVDLLDDAEEWLSQTVHELRTFAGMSSPPRPLVDSPKCPSCSLASVCLPDEVNFIDGAARQKPKRLLVRNSPARPLYAVTPTSAIRKSGERLVVHDGDEKLGDCRLIDVATVSLFGNASISSGAMRACMERDIPVLWFSAGGWFKGCAVPHGGSWVQRRLQQYALAQEGQPGLRKEFVRGKIANQRTLLRRNAGEEGALAVKELAAFVKRIPSAPGGDEIFGLEGAAAHAYFASFGFMLRRRPEEFVFERRNRRPATDPMNAALSFLYALLVRDASVALIAAGLDPQVGFLHTPQFGRPSLALDLMEEFRPLVADSSLIMAVNNGEIKDRDFLCRGGSVALTPRGRKTVIAAYERRMGQELRHPMFGYKVSYRRAVELQARLLAAVIDGEIPDYKALTTR